MVAWLIHFIAAACGNTFVILHSHVRATCALLSRFHFALSPSQEIILPPQFSKTRTTYPLLLTLYKYTPQLTLYKQVGVDNFYPQFCKNTYCTYASGLYTLDVGRTIKNQKTIL